MLATLGHGHTRHARTRAGFIPNTDALASSWIKQVRDAAFELEDVADECSYLSSNDGRSWVEVRSWLALSRRLRRARERLRQLSAAKELYGIRPVNSRMLADSAHFIRKEEVVGFDDHEKKLLEWIAEDAEPQRTLIAVCGMGSIGKTTLVTRVYKEVATSHFEYAAWVAVSQGFTTDDLLGKILKELRRHSEFALRNACNNLVWDKSSDDLGIGEAASILNLSIDDLPHHLKKCFLSCSVYPEDLWLKRKILIRRWVALGLVQDKPGHCSAEDVADEYLDQLIQRNLMHPVAKNEFGRAKRCLIHDLIRELIIHRSREEERYWRFAMCKVAIDSNVRIRHLAVDRCEEVDCQHAPQLPKLRTFYAFGSELQPSVMSHFRLLTVLNLWFIEMKKLPDSVTNLHNLRYLDIRSTLIEELPKELGKLQKLRILDAKFSMVQRLRSSIAKLKALRHLIVLTRDTNDLLKSFPGKAAGISVGLQNLTSLQTFKYVQPSKKMVKSLSKLMQLRSLELSDVNAISNLGFVIVHL
ncbi:hypothetical protein PR202_gb25364 [Eleusine coracana subsp. coracana]|uniref:NB-ARC domain-containing protein n=1 Tax=Eleusine coracana subsp. coracana TaxID=191504 RepID=A0AAV5FL26_ELECO|nr:hypothetical protein PR202_gb25320 [Eleusine coracana subsp. coracana]GJN36501.1 hypothetical protein PR202_gb25364 [Eleusine coracana subsp. coracana]